MQACKALIEQGPNKGNTCERPVIENEYCGRHQRNHEYDLLIKENKIPCNNFFRKCDNTVPKNGKCIDCKNKTKKEKNKCSLFFYFHIEDCKVFRVCKTGLSFYII